VGSAADCAARLAASAAATGVHRQLLMVEGVGPAATGEQITAIGADLLPALAAAGSAVVQRGVQRSRQSRVAELEPGLVEHSG
jgi:hypothetical protein